MSALRTDTTVSDTSCLQALLTFTSIEIDRAGGLVNAIAEFARDKEATHVVLGADGLSASMGEERSAPLGSISDRVVSTVRCNVICCETRLDMEIDAEGSSSRK